MKRTEVLIGNSFIVQRLERPYNTIWDSRIGFYLFSFSGLIASVIRDLTRDISLAYLYFHSMTRRFTVSEYLFYFQIYSSLAAYMIVLVQFQLTLMYQSS